MADNNDNAKYFLGFYGWDKSTRKYISTDEAEKILKMYDFLSMINLIETNYDILINNFFDLYSSLSEISIRNNISFSFKPTDNYYDERTVIRRINNLLSSCRLFMDQNLVFLTEYDKQVLESYKAETHRLYDSSFSYRLCEQLRNSMQHRCLPIELQYGKDFASEENEKAYEYSILELNVYHLLSLDEKKIKASFRDELKTLDSDKIDLWFHLENYITEIGKLITFLRNNMASKLAQDRFDYLKLLAENLQLHTDEKYEIQKMIYINVEYQNGNLGSLILSDSLIKNIELLQEKNDAKKDFSGHGIKV